MITEQDLQAAIAECKGEREPNANTCIKLAAYYTIYDHLYGDVEQDAPISIVPNYSYDAAPSETVGKTIDYESDTEFAQAITGRDAGEIWAIMDELMDVLRVTVPRLYKGVMQKIEDGR